MVVFARAGADELAGGRRLVEAEFDAQRPVFHAVVIGLTRLTQAAEALRVSARGDASVGYADVGATTIRVAVTLVSGAGVVVSIAVDDLFFVHDDFFADRVTLGFPPALVPALVVVAVRFANLVLVALVVALSLGVMTVFVDEDAAR
jgi:hypothetical protein